MSFLMLTNWCIIFPTSQLNKTLYYISNLYEWTTVRTNRIGIKKIRLKRTRNE